MASIIVLPLMLLGFAGIARGQDQSQTTPTKSGTKTVILMTTTPLARLPRSETENDRPAPLVNQNTCGYTSGDWQSAITCISTDSCTYQTTPYSAPFFGCCSEGVSGTAPGCSYLSTCFDYGAASNTSPGDGVGIDGNGGIFCPSARPYCNVIVLYGEPLLSGDPYSFYSYRCVTAQETTHMAFQYTLDSSSMSASTTRDSDYSPLSSLQDSTPVPPETVATTASATSTDLTEESPSNGLSEGAKIGIGVGIGIFASALLILTAIWFWRFRKGAAGRTIVRDKSLGEGSDGPGTVFPAEHRNTWDAVPSAREAKEAPDSGTRSELDAGSRYHELQGLEYHEVPADQR